MNGQYLTLPSPLSSPRAVWLVLVQLKRSLLLHSERGLLKREYIDSPPLCWKQNHINLGLRAASSSCMCDSGVSTNHRTQGCHAQLGPTRNEAWFTSSSILHQGTTARLLQDPASSVASWTFLTRRKLSCLGLMFAICSDPTV